MSKRIKIAVGFSAVLFFVVFSGCFVMQMLNQQVYISRAVSYVTDSAVLPATRGDITDCKGYVIAKDRLCLSLEVGAGISNEDYNELYGILGNNRKKHPPGEMFVIKDVSVATASLVSERGIENVRIIKDYKREYADSVNLSHVLGYTGMISQNEMEQLVDKGYTTADEIGKSGIEKVMEETLRGVDGKRVTKEGKQVFERKPSPGCGVKLTIDKSLQEVVEVELAEKVGYVEEDTGFSSGGAAVVLDVNTGEVLAMASYPDYSNRLVYEDYDRLLSDTANPLLNRCISGCYEPGSVFKPLVALASLDEGVITGDEIIEDMGVYTRYSPDYAPTCHIWNEYGKTHGRVNVVDALSMSCNYYFYEAGSRLGIDKIKKYAELFGFGEKTGIEIEGELSGTLASPETKEWYDGDTLQASIGQSVNMFTPLRLAGFAATLANGGRVYRPYLVKEVTTQEGSSVEIRKPELIKNIPIPQKHFETVRQGMRGCVLSGTASDVFSDYNFTCGGKTGTAQVPSGPENGIFIGFAPFDEPKIAVSVVIEHGSGEHPARIAAEIMEKYLILYEKNEKNQENSENSID